MPFRVRIEVAYDGTDFEGWQRQAEGTPTIQGALEVALSKLLAERIVVIGSGRTDTGVHAEAQTAHFICERDPRSMNFLFGVNTNLPSSVAVQKAWLAPEDFHAQRSADGKIYRYYVYNSRIRNPLKARFSTWFKKPMDMDKLNAMSELLVGEMDFKSFQTGGSEVNTTVRTVTQAHWTRLSEQEMVFQIAGTGFLKQMVRNIVGTLVYLEHNGRGPEEMRAIIQATDRRKAHGTAPGEGLFLHRVLYPQDLDNQCLEI